SRRPIFRRLVPRRQPFVLLQLARRRDLAALDRFKAFLDAFEVGFEVDVAFGAQPIRQRLALEEPEGGVEAAGRDTFMPPAKVLAGAVQRLTGEVGGAANAKKLLHEARAVFQISGEELAGAGELAGARTVALNQIIRAPGHDAVPLDHRFARLVFD